MKIVTNRRHDRDTSASLSHRIEIRERNRFESVKESKFCRVFDSKPNTQGRFPCSNYNNILPSRERFSSWERMENKIFPNSSSKNLFTEKKKEEIVFLLVFHLNWYSYVKRVRKKLFKNCFKYTTSRLEKIITKGRLIRRFTEIKWSKSLSQHRLEYIDFSGTYEDILYKNWWYTISFW